MTSSKTTTDTLIDCVQRGASVELKLHNGESIARFRVHDIIVPVIPSTSNVIQAVVRGIVWPDHGERHDRSINLQDIQVVRDEQLHIPYIADQTFFQRNPVPANWFQTAKRNLIR